MPDRFGHCRRRYLLEGRALDPKRQRLLLILPGLKLRGPGRAVAGRALIPLERLRRRILPISAAGAAIRVHALIANHVHTRGFRSILRDVRKLMD